MSVGNSYVILTHNDKSILVDMINSVVKLQNILLTLKGHNKINVATIK